MAKSLQEDSSITNSEQLPDLRSLREARGLTLDDVSRSTKISLKNLEAMEKGDFKYLPPPVYTRAYIKSYAKLLGLDESQILIRYEKNIAVFVTDEEENAPDVSERASYFSKKIILNSSLVLVLCALGFFVYSYLSTQVSNMPSENVLPKTTADKPLAEVKKSDVPAQQVSSVKAEAAREDGKQPLPQAAAPTVVIPVKPQEKREEAKAPPIKAPSVQPVILVITAREKTWLRITEDQKKTYQLLMQPGERIERSALQYDLFIGNAGGIVVQHQGNTLQTPVALDSVLYINFPHSTAGTTYTVHTLDPGPGIITLDTEISLEDREAHSIEGSIDVTFEDIGGLEKQIRLVREFVQLPLQIPYAYTQLGIKPPRGVIFYGPPGTGKTHLARAIANEISARFFYINGPDIIGTFSGETEGNLRRMFNEAIHHAPSIVIIDELDAIAPKRGHLGTLSDTRAVTQLLSIMDGMQQVNGVIVIGTSNRLEEIDMALRRPGRFDREIFFAPPDIKGRQEILEIHSREMPLDQEAVAYIPELAASTHGFVGADLMEICREAGLNALRRNSDFLKDYRKAIRFEAQHLEIKKEDLEYSLKNVHPSAMREVLITVPQVRWQQVGGLKKVKARLKELIEMPLKKTAVFEELDMTPECGIMLYGPPGTGKTMLAKAIANECGMNFIPLEGPEIFGQWLGESEEAIRHIFHVARLTAPTIIFFDQIEAVAAKRDLATDSRTTARVVSQLLTELDGIERRSRVIVLAATNRIDMLDSSILRSGRFGTHIFVPLPDEDERAEILLLHIGKALHAEGRSPEELVREIALKTQGFSGAELKYLCDEAKMEALRNSDFAAQTEVTAACLEKSLERMTKDRNRLDEHLTS